MLVVFGGLPGTGKSTIARALAARHASTYLRIDEIEQTLRASNALTGPVGPEGYAIAQRIAASNLALGQTVIADCVNPVRESRDGWRATASGAGKPLVEVEVLCSDQAEHRRRVEQRSPDIAGLVLPTWQAVLARNYAPWPEPHIILDTARLTAEDAVALVEQAMAAAQPRPDLPFDMCEERAARG
jgi:predicted kinase